MLPFLLLLGMAGAAWAQAPPPEQTYAVVIGIEKYQQTRNEVTYAENDAAAFRDYLRYTLRLPAENTRLLLNEQATLGGLISAFRGWLPARVRDDSVVFVYYAGHSVPDPESKQVYLLPYDADPNFATTGGYSLNQVYEELNRLPGRQVIVLLDSCFTGEAARGRRGDMLPSGARPGVISVEGPACGQGKVVTLAAAGMEGVLAEGIC